MQDSSLFFLHKLTVSDQVISEKIDNFQFVNRSYTCSMSITQIIRCTHDNGLHFFNELLKSTTKYLFREEVYNFLNIMKMQRQYGFN